MTHSGGVDCLNGDGEGRLARGACHQYLNVCLVVAITQFHHLCPS